MWNMGFLFLSWFSNAPEMGSQHSELGSVTLGFQPMFRSSNSQKWKLFNGLISIVKRRISIPVWVSNIPEILGLVGAYSIRRPWDFHPFKMVQTHSWKVIQRCDSQCETWDFCSCLGSRTPQKWALSTAILILWQWDSNPCSRRLIHGGASILMVRIPLWTMGLLSLLGGH